MMDRDFLQDLFSEFGPVTMRRMFSGYGISVEGINFALALRGGLYFRADDQTIPRFEEEGAQPFQYSTRNKVITVGSYWQLPARLYDDPEELAQWARAALAAAERAAAAKRAKGSRSRAAGHSRTTEAEPARAKPAKASVSRIKKAKTPKAKILKAKTSKVKTAQPRAIRARAAKTASLKRVGTRTKR